MAQIQIDLNSDLGEGFGPWRMGDDPALLKVVTSANIACGFHAGDASIMRRTCEEAMSRNVRIGAHVSYRDLPGFGRREMDVPPPDLVCDVLYQIGALAAIARAAGGEVSYVKPHGALYNRIVWDADQAAAVVEAVRLWDPRFTVLGLPGSRFLELATDAGLTALREGFVDRVYDGQGHLVSRRKPGSVLHDPDAVATQALQLATTGSVTAIDGTTVTPSPRSLCLHGDTPGAATLAAAVRRKLTENGVELVPFV